MYGSQYFFENSKLETVNVDPEVQTPGRIWFNLQTKEFKCSIFENSKVMIKVIPLNIVVFLLLQDLMSNSNILNPIENITQEIVNDSTLVPSSKAVYEVINRIKFKTFVLDGNSLTYQLTHNLNSTNLQVVVSDNNNTSVYPNIQMLNVNIVELSFTELTSGKVNIISYD